MEVRTGPTPPVFSHLAWPLPTDFVAPYHQESFAWGSSRQVAAAHPKAEISDRMSSELSPALLLVELGDTDLKKNAAGTVLMTQLVHLSWGFPVCKAHTKGNN